MTYKCLPHTSTKPSMTEYFLHNSSNSLLAVSENKRLLLICGAHFASVDN